MFSSTERRSLNTKIGLHTHHYHHKLLEYFQVSDQKTNTALFPQLCEKIKIPQKKIQNGRQKNSKWPPSCLKVIFRGEKRLRWKNKDHFISTVLWVNKNSVKKIGNGHWKNLKWPLDCLKVNFRGEKRLGSKYFMATKVLRIWFFQWYGNKKKN